MRTVDEAESAVLSWGCGNLSELRAALESTHPAWKEVT
jgi:hypothetical protein